MNKKTAIIDEVVKSLKWDDKVKSSRYKARKAEGMRCTYAYAAMTEDAAQRRRWTFYEDVIVNYLLLSVIITLIGCGGGKNLSTPPPSQNTLVYKGVMEDYYLQPGDNLEIKFFYNPELNESVIIRPDGKISLQLIDEIQAAGLTPSQLDDILTKKYSSQLKQSVLTVILKSFGGQRIYVGGEVNSPQVLTVVGKVNALQAIFDAGGLRDDA